MGNVWTKLSKYVNDLFYRLPESRVLMIGLDAAGKTTILYRMKLGESVTTIPTIGFNVEDKIRALWRHYFENTDIVAFIIDANDRERLPEAWDELHNRIIKEPTLKDISVMMFLNKQDLPSAISGPEFMETFNIKENLKNLKNWYVVETVAVTGQGLWEAFEILASTKGENPVKSGYYGKNRLQIIYSQLGWSVNRHILFPKSYRRIVWSILLISLKGGVQEEEEGEKKNLEEVYNRNKYWKNIYIPPEIITKIMSFVPVQKTGVEEMQKLNKLLEKYKSGRFKNEFALVSARTQHGKRKEQIKEEEEEEEQSNK